MLFSSGDIVGMDAKRIMSFLNDATEAFGKEQFSLMMGNPYMGISMLKGILWTKFLTPMLGPRMARKYIMIDATRLKERKLAEAAAATAEGVSFVSSNDCLASWFFKGAQCSFGTMLVDCRNFIPGYSDVHAGNYAGCVVYRPAQYATPASIRKSLAKLTQASAAHDSQVPSSWELMKGTYGSFTNVSVSARNIELEGCSEDIHLLIDHGQPIPSSMSSCVIFRAGPGKLGAAVLGTLDVVNRLKEDSIVLS